MIISSPAARQRLIALLITAVIPFGMACSPKPVADPQGDEVSAVDDLQQTISNIRLALTDKNYGSAATQAEAAQMAFPTDPQVHLLAAQAEAYLGNAGNAAAAFQRAIDSGLTEPAAALSNIAFNDVRTSEPFARLRSDFAARGAASARERDRPERRDHIRAGDVEIIADETGDYIRAGDLVLDTRP